MFLQNKSPLIRARSAIQAEWGVCKSCFYISSVEQNSGQRIWWWMRARCVAIDRVSNFRWHDNISMCFILKYMNDNGRWHSNAASDGWHFQRIEFMFLFCSRFYVWFGWDVVVSARTFTNYSAFAVCFFNLWSIFLSENSISIIHHSLSLSISLYFFSTFFAINVRSNIPILHDCNRLAICERKI